MIRLGIDSIRRKGIPVASNIQNAARYVATSTESHAAQPEAPNPYIKEGSATHFGFENIDIHEKEGRVRQVFDRVADNYDIMNDLMSGGLHRYWKDHLLEVSSVELLAKTTRSLKDKTFSILDVAGGTGDVAFRFVDSAGLPERSKSTGLDPVQVTVCDINAEMLRVGETRARERYGSALIDNQALTFRQGNAQKLDNFKDNSYDLYTIAFGLRNVTDVDKALREANRVLKPGGRFMCLEFSQVPNELFRAIYDTYSFHVIPAMGEMVAQDRSSYQYLVESIRKFSNQEELVARMDQAGFQNTRYMNLTGGIVALHEGWKEF